MDKEFSSAAFFIRKMKATQGETVQYHLNDIPLNDFLGKTITLKTSGLIQCINCQRDIKKTFFDGYCYPCFQKLACCDMCILKPELCHYSKGTCREPEWGKEHCLIKHAVYLSNTTGVKVGITREHQKFTRWIDQGALEALVLAEVPERLISGSLEVILSKEVGDKTDWRGLILGKKVEADLLAVKERLKEILPDEFKGYVIENSKIEKFNYPVLRYPEKAKVHNFDKEPALEGILNGIRGQYVFIGERAVNIRKYGGYELQFSA